VCGSVRRVDVPVRTDGVLRVVPGPRDDWFAEGVESLTDTTWTVSATSNRVGLRLTGENPVVRVHEGELPSEGMIAGSIQVPPNGEPVVFLRDHAVTGGYPVIATVIPEDLDAAAQLPPGATVTFVETTEEFS
jgi:allophanate hydrolase subunit 2